MQRECPFCAEQIQARAKICRFCGAKVEPRYVENPSANKQICKIMDWYRDGKDGDAIAKLMNESGEVTLDTDEAWTSDRIDSIISSFGGDEKKIVKLSSTPSKSTNSSPDKNWWLIGLGIAAILVIANIIDRGVINEPTEEEIAACKNLIWRHNRYEQSRMKYAGKESGAIIIDYRTPTYGNYWKLRCKDGKPQVWAPGGSVWMDI